MEYTINFSVQNFDFIVNVLFRKYKPTVIHPGSREDYAINNKEVWLGGTEERTLLFPFRKVILGVCSLAVCNPQFPPPNGGEYKCAKKRV